jgi:hypothetical protein
VFSPDLVFAPQVPAAAGEWADGRVHSGSVLQGQAQAGSALPPPPMFTSWTGAETHLPSLGGKWPSATVTSLRHWVPRWEENGVYLRNSRSQTSLSSTVGFLARWWILLSPVTGWD